MNSRQKGARGERELANILKEYGFECRRGQQYSGANGDPDVVGLPFLHIECKRVERLNLETMMDQAKNDAREDEFAVGMHKKNRRPWYVTCELEDFMRFYKAWLKDWVED